MMQVRAIDMTHATPVDGRGQRSPADVLARTIRDHLLRTAADRFYAGMKHRPAAAMLRTKLIQYRESGWRRDRVEVRCPDRHRGSISELFWQLLKVRDAIPGDRTIRAALAHNPFSIAHNR
jgi:hypothetical protein